MCRKGDMIQLRADWYICESFSTTLHSSWDENVEDHLRHWIYYQNNASFVLVSRLASKVVHVPSSGAYITQSLYVHIPHPEMVGKAISLTQRIIRKQQSATRSKKSFLMHTVIHPPMVMTFVFFVFTPQFWVKWAAVFWELWGNVIYTRKWNS